MIPVGWLRLRPWEGDDTAWVYDAAQDAEIGRFTTMASPFTPVAAAVFVGDHARPQPEPGGAWFAVEHGDSGELFGSIAVVFDGERGGEISYWVAREARGRGVATAALGGISQWCFGDLGLAEVHLRISPGNAASIVVAERAGFVREGTNVGDCHDGADVTDSYVYVRRAS